MEASTTTTRSTSQSVSLSLIWPDLNEPDVIISVGTGRSLDNYATKQPTNLKAMASKGFISQGMFLANLARDTLLRPWTQSRAELERLSRREDR